MKTKTTRKPKEPKASTKAPKPADLMRVTTDHLDLVGGLLLHLGDFLEHARPEELHLLDDLVYEWQSVGGQFEKGNFFKVVVRTIMKGKDTRSLL